MQEALISINLASPRDGDLPSPEITSLLEELMNKMYFEDADQERVNYKEAFDRINNILLDYDLEMVPNRTGRVAQLRPVAGDYVSSVLTHKEATRKITFCPSVFKAPAEGVAHDLVSVMMPFPAHFTPVYKAIGNACDSARLRCQRADDIWKDSTIWSFAKRLSTL